MIDNNLKILRNPGVGQCTGQEPYFGKSPWKNISKITMLFDLDNDYHELHDLSQSDDPAIQVRTRIRSAVLLSICINYCALRFCNGTYVCICISISIGAIQAHDCTT